MVQPNSHAFLYCPKCGSSAFKSGDNGRSFNCEACRFNYYINNSAAVACLIFNSLGHLLLTRRAFEPNVGMLDLPGGFVEPNESAEEAVRREIREELNLTVTNIRYIISFPNLYPFSNLDVPTIDLAYFCDVESFDPMRPDDDVASIEFLNPRKITMKDLCSNSMRQIITFYLISANSK